MRRIASPSGGTTFVQATGVSPGHDIDSDSPRLLRSPGALPQACAMRSYERSAFVQDTHCILDHSIDGISGLVRCACRAKSTASKHCWNCFAETIPCRSCMPPRAEAPKPWLVRSHELGTG